MNIRHLLIKIFPIIIMLYHGKLNAQYDEIKSKVNNTEKNTLEFSKYSNEYIRKAKYDKNYNEIILAYLNRASNYQLGIVNFKYLDSALSIATKFKKYDLIAYTHLIRAENYNHINNKKIALSYFLKAYDASIKSSDPCVRHQVQLKFGIAKMELGYYDDAIADFNQCLNYLDPKTPNKYFGDEKVNHLKEYLNALFQCSVAYRFKGDLKKSDSLTFLGLNLAKSSPDFHTNKLFFLQNIGISLVQKNSFSSALVILKNTLPILYKEDHLKMAALSEFYIGKCYFSLGSYHSAISKFKKVDSVIILRKIANPEIRENYFYLINYFKKQNDTKNELYFTNKLLKYDSVLTRDVNFLSSSIHKKYDTKFLMESKVKLELDTKRKDNLLLIISIGSSLVVLLLFRFIYTQKRIKRKYNLLVDALENETVKNNNAVKNDHVNVNISKTKFTINDIITKLVDFEKNHEYREKNLTLKNLASQFNTNSTYLSQVINETKNNNFNKYLATLRINYITNVLYNETKYLNYTIQALAEEAGFNSRQSFSDLFYEINGLRPKDFIKNRKANLK